MNESPQFIYILRPTRPAMVAEGPTAREKEIIGAHFAYLEGLTNAGTVLVVGRTQTTHERTFGVVIYRAASEAEARSLAAADPAVANGIMEAEVFPFRIALQSLNPNPAQAPTTP